MISVGCIDGGKGLSLRYSVEGGGDMDLETELEEGEACFQKHTDDDSTIDPDVALSYLDEKLQDVLGHFQKDFEGGVSVENLGAKFGGYGSFLPTYQRSPVCPHPKTPPKLLTNNAFTFPNDLHLEGGRQNSVSISASLPTSHGPASTSGAPLPAPRYQSSNTKVKKEVQTSSCKAGEKISSNGPINSNFANTSDQKSLKVRIRVGSDNLSTRKNAEIYSGLGLEVSPPSSLEASPVDIDAFCHAPHDNSRDESPTSILEMMTSFPVVGGLLLSPLPDNLWSLMEKVKFEDSSCGAVHKRTQENTFTIKSESKVDQNAISEKKPKTEDSFVLVEPSRNDCNGIVSVMKKEAEMDNMSCKGLVSNALRLPLLSDKQGDVLYCRKGATSKDGSSVVSKEEPLDQVLTHDDFRVEKPQRKDGTVGNAISDEERSGFSVKSDSNVSKGSKFLETGLIKPQRQKATQKATSREKDSMRVSTSSSGGKRISKGSQSLENDFQSIEASNEGFKKEYSSKSRKNIKVSKIDVPKNIQGKVREAYKDFFGEDPVLEDVDDVALEEKPFRDRSKDYRVDDKGTFESNGTSKERLNRRKDPKASLAVDPAVCPVPHIEPTIGTVPVSDAAPAMVAAVVNEDWVQCEKCEKWRLLPPGRNTDSLPDKWLCSMLDWLPGMNRCSISQDETTKAITTPFPCPAPGILGVQTGVTSVDPLQPSQRHQPFDPPGVKKKHVTKDLPNGPKREGPSLSFNSAKKNLQTSNKTRSLSDANQSPLVNELEIHDSGQSSSMNLETRKLKHKEKKNQREKFVDEGNNTAQLKIRNKREAGQDYSRDFKKVKTEDNYGVEKEKAYGDVPSRKDHRKYDDRSKDTKSSLKVLGINSKNQTENRSYQMGNLEERNVAKKRKANEFEHSQIEEMSETRHGKGKKARDPESQEEEGFASKGGGGADGRGILIDSSRKDAALLAATSSSSKISGSHKTKGNPKEPKGSPVESVSSFPLRILHPDKLTSSGRNIEGVNTCQDTVRPKKTFHVAGGGVDDEKRRNDNQFLSNGSCSRKNSKRSSSRSKDKSRDSKSDIVKVNIKIPERMYKTNDHVHGENSKGGRNISQQKPCITSDKFEKGSASKTTEKPLAESATKDTQATERDGERFIKQDMPRRGKPHSLPPSGKGQNETARPPLPAVFSQKENLGNALLVDVVEGCDASKTAKQKKKSENLNVNQSVSVRHPTPNRHKGRDQGVPSPHRRESSSHAATALKEAKDLKHMADRFKNSGSNESNSLYFQATLKFLYGSSLLESSYTVNGKHEDKIQSVDLYSSTAKLCEYVAHEYEKSKEMAAAALAYKLAEVAYLKVVYSSHTNASKDRLELQTSLQIAPTGESPSSSASDIDNLNNPAALDKTALAKSVNDPQIGGNHVIAARNKPNFLRILNFAQDMHLAMEASRRSRVAFAACGSQTEHAHHKEVIKPALDFNFQDVEGLLQLVRVAMEVISR